MTQVWDSDKQELKDVSETDAKELSSLGYATGAEAELKARENGWEGKIGAGATAFGNMLGLGLPKLITRAVSPGTAHEIDSAQEANPKTTFGANLAGGVGSMMALPGAAARIAASAYVGGTEAIDRSAANGIFQEAVKTGDYTHVAELYAQGVGIGGVLGGVTEGAGYALAKAATKSQKAVGRLLTDWSNKGYFQKIQDLTEQEGVFQQVAQRAEQRASELPLGAPFPAERPYAGLTQRPPPLPEVPFAQAELHSDIPAQNIERARARGDYDTRQAARFNEQPMLRDEAEALWHQHDKAAHDYANSQEFGEYGDTAQNDRTLRDRIAGRVSQRVTDGRTGEVRKPDFPDPQDLNKRYFDTPEAARANRNELNTQDPELNAAFDKAGLNAPADPFAQISSAPEVTEMPSGAQVSTPPLNESAPPRFKVAPPGPLAKLKGGKFAKEVPDAKLPMPKLPKLERPVDAIPEGRYEFTKPQKPIPWAKTALRTGASVAGFQMGHPIIGLLMGERAAESGLLQLGQNFAQRAQLAAVNRAQAINLIVDKVTSPGVLAIGRSIKALLEGNTGNISSSYLTGDTDADYKAVVQGVASAQASPDKVMQYVQSRHGALSPDGKMIGAIVGHYQNGINYLAQGMPKQTRAPGLLDGNEPYDPPRSIKVRFLQRYNGVNDPHGSLVAPTHESVAAVQAVHPKTLAEYRQQLAQELADDKKRNKLSSAQMRDISIVMGIPANWIHSPPGISALAAIGQGGQQPPQQGPQPGGKASPAKGVNLGAQGKNYASMVAPPSQANELDNLGEQ